MKSIINRSKLYLILISSIIIGLAAHGMALFNTFAFHDDVVYLNSLGATYTSGRWMLDVLGRFINLITGSRHYSLPLLNGFITIICIALIVYVVSDLLKIESKPFNILLAGIFVTYPAVTGIMGYVYTAPYYYFGTLLGVIGAYIYAKNGGLVSAIICTLLMACSAGVYQANIPVCISTLLLILIDKTYNSKGNWKDFWIDIVKYIAICVVVLIEYVIINKVYLSIMKSQLSDYQGINNFGMTDIPGYISRIIRVYKEFVLPGRYTVGNMYPFSERWLYLLLVLLAAILVVVILKECYSKNKAKATQLLLLLIVFPLAAYFIFVMVKNDVVHGLMIYGTVFTHALLIWLVKNIGEESKIVKYVKTGSLCIVVAIIVLNIRFSNICYLKAEALQSQAISYYNTLATRIKDCDGYDDDMPVVYINEYDKKDNSFVGTEYLFDTIKLPPYDTDTIINDYSWKEMMKLWCGFDPVVGDETAIKDKESVNEMPSYPDDESIQVMDGQIVVKF